MRDAILDVARRRFLAEGYATVTLRSIATEAGVDVALISYHFGSKRGLFGACLALTANPTQVLAEVVADRGPDLPRRLLQALLTVWDDPQRRAPLRRMFEAVVGEPEFARLFREVVEREFFGVLADKLPGGHAAHRATAAISQLAGLIHLRYIVAAEPLASMPRSEVIRYFEPGLRAALQAAPAPARRRTGGLAPPTR